MLGRPSELNAVMISIRALVRRHRWQAGGYALVTGSASGLGRAIAQQLASQGCTLALVDRDARGNAQTLALLPAAAVRRAASEATGHSVHTVDVASAADWSALFDDLRGRWPRIDWLVNCAGVCGAGEIGEFPLADWQWLLDINLFGVIQGCHTFVPWLRENSGAARIVNIASVAAIAAAPSMAAYNVAKAGVVALSETLYAELRPQGVSVTVVCPGFFTSQLLEQGRFAREEYHEAATAWMRSSPTNAERVARQVVRAAMQGRLYLFVPSRARWLWRVKRLLPTVVARLISLAYVRSVGQRPAAEPLSADGQTYPPLAPAGPASSSVLNDT